MKKVNINVNFDKTDDVLAKKYTEQYYKDLGLKGQALYYNILGDDLSDEEFLFLSVDYIARVCWAFHNQKQIEFLYNYKQIFFDLKIGKITESNALDKLLAYENKHLIKSHGLINLFGSCIRVYKESGFDSFFWCDNLIVNLNPLVKSKIGIIYMINDDYKIRGLLNPIKQGLFHGVQFLEHIESLNLILYLAYNKIKKENDKKKFINIIDTSFEYFINNPKVTETPEESNSQVYRLVNELP